ncbi:LuxR C-terminal-related transcriptional regulator [Vibrio sp. ZSDZ65]|uniref:LuxR C-terminal-related transcriptional regulator n=1 Tax=Vibrio qingdaonensis TaxID=2829491 RepID=A0A9X3HX24_9VIBR|nr:LuxR C-terminal-related transcriptional regulator [Vibrio qingdaonensis]MCW8346372.1 LuxR C-terminal-related transcriptional regulator [Vibrio qingdaonensis]
MTTNFEALLMNQSNRLTASRPNEFLENFVGIVEDALEWFKLDRLTVFPNSMILLNDGKTISVSRKGIPELDKQRFLKGNYKDYLRILRSKQPWQIFDSEALANHPLDPIKELYREGACWHGIIRLELFGQTWGALAFSRFSLEEPPLSEENFKRLKLLSDMWLCFWQHATMTRNLSLDDSSVADESEKLLLLSKKQCTVLTLLSQGYTAKQCAEKLFLSSRTIESHKYRMLDILDLDNHTELVQFALRNGLGIESTDR